MKVVIKNLATEYQDEGTGPVMLFLHGWQDDLHTFDPLVPPLSSTGRMIRLDLPGFGGSEMPKKAWNLDNYVQFVKDFIQKLNIQVDFLVGHSFGGRIVIKGLATKQLQADKAVLIASAGVSKNKKLRNLILKIIAKAGRAITYLPPLSFWREKIREKMYNKLDSDYISSGPLKGTLLKIISEDLSSSAENIKCPVLLIWGVDDVDTPLTDGKLLSKLIGGSELKVLNDADHMVHREKPQEVAGLIRKFL